MSSINKKRLSSAISSFSSDIRTSFQQWDDGVASLKRAIDHGVRAGPHEFKDALGDLEDDVATITAQLEQLDHYTCQTISVEELLGHCAGLYHTNRQGIVRLEAHLKQYGYQPQGPLKQPNNPLTGAAPAEQPSSGANDHSLRDQGCYDDSDDEGPGTAAAFTGGVRVSRVAPNTPHYAMSHDAKIKLRGRVKTPGITLSRRVVDSSEDEEDDDYDDLDMGGVMQQQQQPAVGRRTGSPGNMVPQAQASWGDDDDEEDEADVDIRDLKDPQTTRTTTPGAMLATGSTTWLRSATTNTRPPAAATTALTRPTPGQTGVKAVTPGSMESCSPEDMMVSPSFAALQAKYGGGGGDDAAVPDMMEHKTTGVTYGGESMGASLGSTTTISNVQAPGLAIAPANRFLAPGHTSFPSSYLPPAEEDTCMLYAQLIRSKDVPASLAAASSRGSGGTMAASMPKQLPTTRKSLPALPLSIDEGQINDTAADGSTTPITTYGGGGGVGGRMPTPSPPRSRSAPRSALSRVEGARATLALEAQLSALQLQWETSGQAALTPRRGAAVAAPNPSKFQDLPAQAAHVTAHMNAIDAAPVPGQGGTAAVSQAFEFPRVSSLSTGWDTGTAKRQGVAAETATGVRGGGGGAWLRQDTSSGEVGTSKIDERGFLGHTMSSAAVDGRSSKVQDGTTPGVMGPGPAASRSLSPGTAQLVSRVYGGNNGGGNGMGMPGTIDRAWTGLAGSNGATANSNSGADSYVGTGHCVVSQPSSLPTPAMTATVQTMAAISVSTTTTISRPTTASTTTSSTPPSLQVTEAQFGTLPSFLRTQLSLADLNRALTALPGLSPAGSTAGPPESPHGGRSCVCTLDAVQSGLGWSAQQSKVLVNCLVKLNRATMQGGSCFTIRSS